MRGRRVASGCGGHGAVSWRGKLAMREEQKVISAWAAFTWGKRSRLAMHVGRRNGPGAGVGMLEQSAWVTCAGPRERCLLDKCWLGRTRQEEEEGNY